MSAWSTIRTLLPETWRQTLREAQVKLSLKRVSGPQAIDVRPNDAVVTCVVKNGEWYVDQFIEHYLSLGFRHICFMDNGSTDETIQRAMRHSSVTVYRCTLPVGDQQGRLKKRLAELAVPAGWCLDVDIDEFFDYPYSDVLPLRRFLAYLNSKSYTAVVTQMLDMFSEKPLSSLADRQQENLRQVHRYYDISQVTKIKYHEDALTVANGHANRVANPETALYWGGIRKTVYGVKCCLTKHSLFRTGAGLDLFPHVHYVNRAMLADVSGTLLHYKFTSNALNEAAQNTTAFLALSAGYERIVAAITDRPDFRIKSDTAQQLRSVSDLLNNRFLFASEDYRSYVKTALIPAATSASRALYNFTDAGSRII